MEAQLRPTRFQVGHACVGTCERKRGVWEAVRPHPRARRSAPAKRLHCAAPSKRPSECENEYLTSILLTCRRVGTTKML